MNLVPVHPITTRFGDYSNLPEKIDPYVVWVDSTDGKGLTDSAGKGATSFSVIIELKRVAATFFASPDQLPAVLKRVPALYWDQDVTFVTATISGSELTDLVTFVRDDSKWVANFELSTAFADPANAKGRPLVSEAVAQVSGNVIVVVDTACPFLHPLLRDSVNKSRVKYLWDQNRIIRGGTPYFVSPTIVIGGVNTTLYGGELSAFDRSTPIEKLVEKADDLSERDAYAAADYEPMRNESSHGASVISLAAGPSVYDGEPGAADEAPIIFVQMPASAIADSAGGALRRYALDALHYARVRTKRALPAHAPTRIAVTMSLGRHAGPHDGSSHFERALDQFVQLQRSAGRDFFVSIAADNAFQLAGHACFSLKDSEKSHAIEFDVFPSNPTWTFVEVWYRVPEPNDQPQHLAIHLTAPGCDEELYYEIIAGAKVTGVVPGMAKFWGREANQDPVVAVVHGKKTTPVPSKKEVNRCALIAIAPTISVDGSYLEAPCGTWTMRAVLDVKAGKAAIETEIHCWIERAEQLIGTGWGYRQSAFVVDPTEDSSAPFPPNSGVEKRSTQNGMATGSMTYSVGARYSDVGPSAGDLPEYTPAGPRRASTKLSGIDWTAEVDWSVEFPGMDTMANVGTGVVRFGGTSAAAPQVARKWLNNKLPSYSSPPDKTLDALRGRSRRAR